MFEPSSGPKISRRLALRLSSAFCGSALFLFLHWLAANGQAQDHSAALFISVTYSPP